MLKFCTFLDFGMGTINVLQFKNNWGLGKAGFTASYGFGHRIFKIFSKYIDLKDFSWVFNLLGKF